MSGAIYLNTMQLVMILLYTMTASVLHRRKLFNNITQLAKLARAGHSRKLESSISLEKLQFPLQINSLPFWQFIEFNWSHSKVLFKFVSTQMPFQMLAIHIFRKLFICCLNSFECIEFDCFAHIRQRTAYRYGMSRPRCILRQDGCAYRIFKDQYKQP